MRFNLRIANQVPCGRTVCNSHLLDSSGCFQTSFNSQLCTNQHDIPLKGFYPNFFIQKQIEQLVHLSDEEIDLKNEFEEGSQRFLRPLSGSSRQRQAKAQTLTGLDRP